MNKQRLILILLGLIIAVGSAYGMYIYTGNLERKINVAVVIKNIKAYEKIEPGNVQLVSMPAKYILPNAVTNINALVGKEAKVDMYRGEQVIQDRIGEGIIKPSTNERLIFIPTQDVIMKQGEKVDIYLVYVPGKSKYEGSERLLADKLVATVIGDTGLDVNDVIKGDMLKKQSGIEVLLTHEEILLYLERIQYAKDVIVRQGRGELN